MNTQTLALGCSHSAFALQVHTWGANALAIERGKKKPAHLWTRYQTERQSSDDVRSLPWQNADRAGIVNGVNGWRSFDLDGCLPGHAGASAIWVILGALGLSHDYAWLEVSAGDDGFHIWVRCDDPLPVGALTAKEGETGVYWGESHDGTFDHLELRWERNQTIVAASGDSSRWLNGKPTGPPACVRVGAVLDAFRAVATPKEAAKPKRTVPPSHQTDDRGEMEMIRAQFDMVAYASMKWPGEVQHEGDEVRILGNGGLLIKPGSRVWWRFDESVGGDCFELVGRGLYGEQWDRKSRTMFPLAVREAAAFAGIVPRAPGPQPEARADDHDHDEPETTGDAAVGVPDHATIGIVPALAKAILETDHFAIDPGGKLYVYSGGAYRSNGAAHVAKRALELLDSWGESKKWSTHRAAEVTAYIATNAPELWERPPLDRINVKNGIVDIATKTLCAHTPGFLSGVQLPITFDPGATCPAWEAFVDETFPADAHDLAWEIPADLMQPDRSDQRSVLFTGEGGNGKSTYLRGVRAFIGKRNVASMSLQKMESDRFAVAGLLGKLGNICADLPSAHLETTSTFKAITGGDTLYGEYKHRDPFDFLPFTRLLFSANHFPRSSDSSHAFFRRWLVVPFERTFEGDEAIPMEVLDARLAQPCELSGLLNKALTALPRLRRNGFTVSPTMRKAWEEFRETTDPFVVWLDHATASDPDGYVPRAALRKAYADHCRTAGHPMISDTAFGNAMRRLRPTLTFGQRTVDGKAGVWCYLGIRFNNEKTPPPTPKSPGKGETGSTGLTGFPLIGGTKREGRGEEAGTGGGRRESLCN